MYSEVTTGRLYWYKIIRNTIASCYRVLEGLTDRINLVVGEQPDSGGKPKYRGGHDRAPGFEIGLIRIPEFRGNPEVKRVSDT